jgi:hypothetical protein
MPDLWIVAVAVVRVDRCGATAFGKALARLRRSDR